MTSIIRINTTDAGEFVAELHGEQISIGATEPKLRAYVLAQRAAGRRISLDGAALDALADGPLAGPCGAGEITGVRCEGSATVEVEHVPEHLRASHVAAGNRGRWPANGASRIRLCEACAGELVGDWTERVER